MNFKIKGEIYLKGDMSGLLAILLKYKEIPMTSIKRKDYIVEFIVDTMSETKLKDILQELSKYSQFKLLKIKERKW